MSPRPQTSCLGSLPSATHMDGGGTHFPPILSWLNIAQQVNESVWNVSWMVRTLQKGEGRVFKKISITPEEKMVSWCWWWCEFSSYWTSWERERKWVNCLHKQLTPLYCRHHYLQDPPRTALVISHSISHHVPPRAYYLENYSYHYYYYYIHTLVYYIYIILCSKFHPRRTVL